MFEDEPVLSSEMLGFPPDARVLIVNADDLGMHPAVNRGVLDAIENGIARSCSVMAPCPAAADALALLRERPHIPFGVHLTLVRDTPADTWTPLSRDVPTLVDSCGRLFLHAQAAQLLAGLRIDDVQREFRAQLDVVLAAGLRPTHLDFHSLADGGRGDVLDIALLLAEEHDLAVRVWLDRGRAIARSRGRPVVDHPFLDSFSLDIEGKAERYSTLLRSLPAGLSEWAVHPAASSEPPGGPVRATDHEFLVSDRARELVVAEDIVLIDYRPLQRMWTKAL
jgi:chitin disaccharide deacetylase